MSASPDDMGFLAQLGVLSNKLDQRLQPFGGATNLGAALLANSGYSPAPRNFGEILGTSVLQGQQLAAQRQNDDIRKRYMEAQIEALKAKPPTNEPSSVKEYEYAKRNGFKGTYQDWIVAGGQSSRPSAVQEWEFYNSLPPEQQARYLEMKRNPNFFYGKLGEVPTITRAPTAGLPAQSTPLSTLQSESAAAQEIKRAEGQGAGLGQAQGAIAGGIQTKGANAVSTKNLLDVAEPLIDIATGSATGAARDAVAKVFGGSTDGANAIAKLKVLQAGLMTSMPRMEGPQSDRDVMLYREAAGQIGDPMVPAEQKKAAVETIREIQNKYIDRAAGGANKPRRVRVDAQGNVIGN